MPLVNLVIGLIVEWVNRFIPTAGSIKMILKAVVVISARV